MTNQSKNVVITREEIHQMVLDASTGDLSSSDLMAKIVAKVEKVAIEESLTITRGNKTQSSLILGLNRGTFHKRIKAFNLQRYAA